MKIKVKLLKRLSGAVSDLLCDYEKDSYDYEQTKPLLDELDSILKEHERRKNERH